MPVELIPQMQGVVVRDVVALAEQQVLDVTNHAGHEVAVGDAVAERDANVAFFETAGGGEIES